jgi:hypothetical protein
VGETGDDGAGTPGREKRTGLKAGPLDERKLREIYEQLGAT